MTSKFEVLKDGLSEECCFDNHNITTENIKFETGEDPVALVQRIFVSYHKCSIFSCNTVLDVAEIA